MYQKIESKLNFKQLPNHIAIIMDGNYRWAKAKGFVKVFGHKKGAENIEIVATKIKEFGIKYLSLYAFSTENWKRSKDEIASLMKILIEYISENFIQKMLNSNIRVNFIGDIDYIKTYDLSVWKSIEKVVKLTKNCDNFFLNIAFNYGSRNEIIRAMKKYFLDIKDISEIKEQNFEKYLDTAKLNIPDPDLLIRTGGMTRLSNFLLWQIAYTEIYITDVFWPDFNEKEIEKALSFFENKKRNFGGRV